MPFDLLTDEFPTSLDSMEGVPYWPQPKETEAERLGRGRWLTVGARWFERLGTMVPGIVLAAALAWTGELLALGIGTSLLGFAKSPIGGIPLIILLGLALRNTIGLPKVYESGLRFCLRYVLRLGIVLLGLRLSLGDVGEIGLLGLPVIVICIATALLVVTWVSRALALPPRLGSLIAVGTSICGVSAIVATAPVIEAEEDEVSYAVSCVALFGMLALVFYPFCAHWAFAENPGFAGIFLGTAIHDTAQVAGAGLLYQEQFAAPQALGSAAVTKLLRNVFMAGVIPLVAILYRRKNKSIQRRRQPWHQAIPLFVIGFVVMAAIRTCGDLAVRPDTEAWDGDFWKRALELADRVSSWCLAAAMAAVGLGTGLAKLKTLGLRPFAVGLAAALLVGGVSLMLLKTIEVYVPR